MDIKYWIYSRSEIRLMVLINEIVELFEKRMQLSAEVAEYKISNNKAVLDPQREKEKLNTLEKYASNSFNRVGVY